MHVQIEVYLDGECASIYASSMCLVSRFNLVDLCLFSVIKVVHDCWVESVFIAGELGQFWFH